MQDNYEHFRSEMEQLNYAHALQEATDQLALHHEEKSCMEMALEFQIAETMKAL
jgi:hypothetical protein